MEKYDYSSNASGTKFRTRLIVLEHRLREPKEFIWLIKRFISFFNSLLLPALALQPDERIVIHE